MCPEEAAVRSGIETGVNVASYESRGQRCTSGSDMEGNTRGDAQERGMWWMDVRCATLCKYASVGLMMGYAPGETVFDWGLGCGTAVGWLERIFSVRTTGHELVRSSARVAENVTGATKVCWGDGSTLAHIPDASVDHVTSNAAVYHLRGATQCSLVLDHLLRILRPGGTLWIGWQLVEDKNDLHGATPFRKEDWRQCMERAGNAVYFHMPDEAALFGDTEYGRSTSFSVMAVKKYTVRRGTPSP